jgi:hypothetical protein
VSEVALKASIIASRVAAFAFGVIWGFFVAFNVVFSDVFGIGEMAGAVGFVAVAYAVLGLAFGFAGPVTGWRWMWWLGIPGTLLVVLGLFDNVSRAIYHAAVIAAVVGGSAGGAWLGSWTHVRFSRRPATP